MAKAKKKRTNPRNQPATMADVNKAKKEATSSAVECAWAIMFVVLRDKMGFELEDLQRLFYEADKYADQLKKGEVTVPDLKTVLKEEAGVMLKWQRRW